MESLPEEIVHHIAQYLLVEDLSNCCVVSVGWREMFGRDCLWRPHCDSPLIAYLNTTQPVVKPYFVTPEVDGSTLSDIEEWRLSYMKQTHLRNNWRKANYKRTHVTLDKKDLNRHARAIVYKNDYILFLSVKENTSKATIEVWEFLKTPRITLELSLVCNVNRVLQIFEVADSDEIVVLQGFVVQVFSLNLTSYPYLKRLQLFSMLEPENCPEVSDEAALTLLTNNEHSGSMVYAVIKTYIVGYQGGKIPMKLYVWDIETGEKLKEVIVDYNKTSRDWLHFCEKTMNVIINTYEFQENGDCSYHFYVFNLVQLDLLNFEKSFKLFLSSYVLRFYYAYNIMQNYVAIRMQHTLYVYDYNNSQLLFETTGCQGNITLFRNRFVFQLIDCYMVYAPSSNTIETKINRHTCCSGLYKTVYELAIIEYHVTSYHNPSDIISCATKESTQNNKTKKNSFPIYHCFSEDVLLSNKNGTKLVIYNPTQIGIVHFW